MIIITSVKCVNWKTRQKCRNEGNQLVIKRDQCTSKYITAHNKVFGSFLSYGLLSLVVITLPNP